MALARRQPRARGVLVPQPAAHEHLREREAHAEPALERAHRRDRGGRDVQQALHGRRTLGATADGTRVSSGPSRRGGQDLPMGRRKPRRAGLACTAMAATRGEVAWPTIADRLRLAGGVMSVREGHAVAANFGSAATELAICVKRVGLAVRSDLDALEIAGPEPWLAHFLEERWAAAPRRRARPSARPAAGAAASRPTGPSSIGPWSAAARWAGIVRHAVVTGAAIDCTDRSDSATALTLVGPRAAQLLDDAGLEPDLPVGGVRESWFAGCLGAAAARGRRSLPARARRRARGRRLAGALRRRAAPSACRWSARRRSSASRPRRGVSSEP